MLKHGSTFRPPCLQDLLHFFIIFFVVIVFFVMTARIIFGADWSEFTTFGGALLTFFRSARAALSSLILMALY